MARPSSSSWLLSRLHGRRHRRGRRLRLCARDCLARCLGQPSSPSSSSLSSKFGPLVGRRWKRGGPFSRSHTRSLMHTHTRIRTYTYTLSISSSRRVPPPSYGEKGRYYIGGILVLARLGPRQFWEWSSKNSRGKSCLCAAAATAAAEQLPALLLLRPHRRRRRRRVAASRSSRYRPGLDNVVIVLPSWSSSSSSSVSRPRDFRGHPRRARIRRDYLPLLLPPFLILKKPRHFDRKPSPRHFCDYPRRSSRRASYNIHPLSRFRWRFTNSACRCYPEATRSQPSFRHHPASLALALPLLALRIPVSTDLFLRARELFLVSFPAVC